MAIMEFVQRFQALRVQRDTGDELIKDILIYCETMENRLRQENERLTSSLEEAHLDLEDAKRSRRDLQKQLDLAKQQLVTIDTETNRNPYIMVLIDGDGLVFNEDLIRQGLEGGKQAATLLRNAVLDHCDNSASDIEIVAKVCAHTIGLAKAMIRDGSLSDIDDMRNFALGFTQGKASFDFIDVGYGKERADSKIKEIMRWHIRNHNCRQILLGVSHDAGYAPFLDEVVGQADRSRITIMEGPPAVRELKATGIQILNFNHIFRAEKLIDRSYSNFALPAPPEVSYSASPPTWAGITSTGPLPSPISIKSAGIANSVVKRQSPAPNLPTWIPEPRGIDEPLEVNQTLLEKIRKRQKHLCNNHYLRGPCSKGDDCCFEHNFKATEEDIICVAYLTRLNPCTNGQDCEDWECIYGHHCPAVKVEKISATERGYVCIAFGCRFGKDDHPPGTIIKHPRKERWEKESYF